MIQARPTTRTASIVGAAAFVVVALAVGAIGGWATASSVRTWYPTLIKPGFTPPNGVFAPVWTTLYVVMALAAWRVWRVQGLEGKSGRAIALYAGQLVLNLAWSLIFFGLRAPTIALIDIALLIVSVALTLAAFWRIDRVAGLMLMPYLAWCCFASALNFEIVRLN